MKEKPEDYDEYFFPDGTERKNPFLVNGELPENEEEYSKAFSWQRRLRDLKYMFMTLAEQKKFRDHYWHERAERLSNLDKAYDE